MKEKLKNLRLNWKFRTSAVIISGDFRAGKIHPRIFELKSLQRQFLLHLVESQRIGRKSTVGKKRLPTIPCVLNRFYQKNSNEFFVFQSPSAFVRSNFIEYCIASNNFPGQYLFFVSCFRWAIIIKRRLNYSRVAKIETILYCPGQ